MTDKNWILLLLFLVVIYKLVRWAEEETQSKSWRPPSPPPPKWKHLHRGFKEYEQLWTQAGYDYDAAKKWIDLGVKPNELDLVKWIRETKGLNLVDLDQDKVRHLRYELTVSRRSKAPGIEYYD